MVGIGGDSGFTSRQGLGIPLPRYGVVGVAGLEVFVEG